MTHFIFHEPGCIPGIPGLFAHCRVDIADDGTYTTTPLDQHPHFEPEPGSIIAWHVEAPENTTLAIDGIGADASTADNPAIASQDESTTEAATPENTEEAE